MMKSAIRWLGVVAAAGMFAVLVMGAAVTNTGSEQGCGRQWPLCHGKLIPQMAVKTAIEFTHRAIVGVETILILALAIGALYLYRRRREIQILVPLMVGFLFLQAGLGAWAVLYPQEAGILALHFGVSLISFASVFLTAIYLFEVENRRELRDVAIAPGLRLYVWLLLLFSYVVVYSGAYVRHSHAEDACTGWPLCNGTVVPHLDGSVTAAMGHRFGAGMLTLGILWLVVWTSRTRDVRRDLFRGSVIALGLVSLQALSGAIVVWTRVDLFSALLHAAFVGAMFGVLCYLGVHVIPRGATEEATAPRASFGAEAGSAAMPR